MHDSVCVSKGCAAASDEHEPRADVERAERGLRLAPGCPVCASAAVSRFIEVRGVPVFCNVLWSTRAQAMSAATGDIELSLCSNCGHVFNSAFEAGKVDYTEAYENSLHFSAHFSSYAEHLAHRLIDTYGIREKDVIDVGCGRGDFLSLLCKTGNNRGYGFDKGYASDHGQSASENPTFIREFYGEQFANYPCDLLCCRHVLEHIEQPGPFISGIRNTLAAKKTAVVFFEVPNAAYTLRDLGIWDLIYEHCSYFCDASLHRLFSRYGFTIQRISELYDGQFIGIECTPGSANPAPADVDPHEVLECADRFPERYARKLDYWRGVADELQCSEQRAVIWGGGSKGVTFLNLLKPSAVVGVVDLNPRKHGRFVPGTGHEVISPERLPEIMPDVVIVMNEVYKDEIREDLNARGLTPELLIA
jgi:hypothetical protein